MRVGCLFWLCLWCSLVATSSQCVYIFPIGSMYGTYIYLHLVDFCGKCRVNIPVPWISLGKNGTARCGADLNWLSSWGPPGALYTSKIGWVNTRDARMLGCLLRRFDLFPYTCWFLRGYSLHSSSEIHAERTRHIGVEDTVQPSEKIRLVGADVPFASHKFPRIITHHGWGPQIFVWNMFG